LFSTKLNNEPATTIIVVNRIFISLSLVALLVVDAPAIVVVVAEQSGSTLAGNEPSTFPGG
jgi:hypothetical protein